MSNLPIFSGILEVWTKPFVLQMLSSFPQRLSKCRQAKGQFLQLIRSAILLDQYEINDDRDLLVQSRKYVGKAYAVHQSEEIKMLYRRLGKLEEELHRKDAEHSRD